MHALSAVWLTTCVVTVVAAATLCVLVRRFPGRPATVVNLFLSAILLGTSAVWIAQVLRVERFDAATSLPFALCDLATLIAALALATRARILVELTYFWGLAGTLQSLLTPDLSVPFPHLEFFEYVLAHAGIVCAAVVLVVGERVRPGRWAVGRVFLITVCYTAVVGLVDWLTGGNYMYLRRRPGAFTLLDVLGPWPWYIASAAAVAVALFLLLDLPFSLRRKP
ncbi:MAG: TMEM164-related integral membrane acyltransferase [Acidimicrobiales bacterium]